MTDRRARDRYREKMMAPSLAEVMMALDEIENVRLTLMGFVATTELTESVRRLTRALAILQADMHERLENRGRR